MRSTMAVDDHGGCTEEESAHHDEVVEGHDIDVYVSHDAASIKILSACA